ncbi:hypothetical protein JL721_1540 [Aureococcus anophagefferens]|nr:hypothetical protein JL721_1540 [Aureococcus anophagefferens]
MASTNVRVAVRCRPLSSKETTMGARTVVNVNKADCSIKVEGDGSEDSKEHMFTFDHVYAPGTNQKDIYDEIGAPLITKALEGYNGTMFAYGQTGSGKTFTMMGVPSDGDLQGIIPRLTGDLFGRVDGVLKDKGGDLGGSPRGASRGKPPAVDADGEAAGAPGEVRFMITVSYLEIYNEVIHDLLNPTSGDNLKIREHPDLGIYVEPLCELSVTGQDKGDSTSVKNPDDIFRLLDQGNKVRRVASTQMNERSSRSHSVFTVKIQQKTAVEEDGVRRETALASKLNLVDLAGSERASKTGAEGSTLKEGAAINQSLMALGGVINALSEGAPFVPYRNSKLTRLLQESLGGNAATIMVANCSPADYNAEETTGTLRYASRAKKIQNKVTRNEDVHEKVIRELQEEIDRLRAALEAGGGGEGGAGDLSEAQERELQEKVRESRKRERELADRIAAIEQQKDEGWEERARLSAELEAERKNNMNAAVADVMSSVKEEKLALLAEIRRLSDLRAKKLKEQAGLKGPEEERLAFQSQKDAYLAAQLEGERKKMADQADRLVRRETVMKERVRDADTVKQKLDGALKENALLKQELAMVKLEGDHLKHTAEVLTKEVDEKHKLEKEVEDLERRVHDSEYEAEVEKEKAEAVQEELWKLEHTSKLERAKLEELRALHAAKGGDVHLTQEEVEKHKAVKSGLQAKLGDALNYKHQAEKRIAALDAELKSAHADLEAERREKAAVLAAAKDKEFEVFKSVMDVAGKERDALGGELNRLKALLQNSVQDILFLQNQNLEYKAELDLRRLDDD